VSRRNQPEPSFLPVSLEQPHSAESERAVLGSVMLDSELLARVAGRLAVADFHLADHQVIYRAMLDLHAQGTAVDERTLQARLEQQGLFEQAGGMAYLATLDLDLPDIGRLDAYIEIITERSARRAVLKLAGEAMRDGFGPAAVEETLARLQGEVPRLLASVSRPRLRGMGEILPPFLEAIEDRGDETLLGLPTGFARFDDLTAGLHSGHLVIVGGRPGMGKSALAFNVAQNLALRGGHPVGIWSLEMTEQEVALRMLCSEAEVPSAVLTKGHLSQAQWSRVVRAGRALAAAPLYVDDTGGLSITQLEGRIRRACGEQSLALAVVDYLQLVQPPAGRRQENRNIEVGLVSGTLKALAKDLHIPIMALSQLSRESTRRAGSRPTLADLRDSGAIEADADLVALMHREHVYDPKAPPTDTEAIIAKYRHGPTGAVRLLWISETTTFRNPAAAGTSAIPASPEETPF
jgi:replicative DNA helicase